MVDVARRHVIKLYPASAVRSTPKVFGMGMVVLCIIVSLSPLQPDTRASNYHLKTDGMVASRQITVSLRKRPFKEPIKNIDLDGMTAYLRC
jgi:hypothetical protein